MDLMLKSYLEKKCDRSLLLGEHLDMMVQAYLKKLGQKFSRDSKNVPPYKAVLEFINLQAWNAENVTRNSERR